MPREPRIVYGPVPNRNPVDTWTPTSMLDPQWIFPSAPPPNTNTYEPSQTDEEPGMKPIRPDEVPLAAALDISQRGGPIDKINEALRKPWTKWECLNGRTVSIQFSELEREAVISHYEEAGWKVTWHASSDPRDYGLDSNFVFRMPPAAAPLDDGLGGR